MTNHGCPTSPVIYTDLFGLSTRPQHPSLTLPQITQLGKPPINFFPILLAPEILLLLSFGSGNGFSTGDLDRDKCEKWTQSLISRQPLLGHKSLLGGKQPLGGVRPGPILSSQSHWPPQLLCTFTQKACFSPTRESVSVGFCEPLLYGFTMCENVCNVLGSNLERWKI